MNVYDILRNLLIAMIDTQYRINCYILMGNNNNLNIINFLSCNNPALNQYLPDIRKITFY